MVRRTFEYVAGALLLLLMIVAAGLFWLAGTNSGARWLLVRANSSPEVQISAEVNGTLWAGLELNDLMAIWSSGRIEVDQLKYSWQPLALLGRHLSVDSIEIGSLRFSQAGPVAAETGDRSPLAIIDSLWQMRPVSMYLNELSLRNFSLDKITWSAGSEEPLVLTELRGEVGFQESVLHGEKIHVRLPDASLSGSASVDFDRRQISGNLLWQGAVFFADWDGLQTRFTLKENLAGSFQAKVLAGTTERLSLQGDAALTSNGASLTKLILARNNAADRVTGKLDITWADKLQISPDLQLNHLNLEAETGWPTDLSGTLTADIDADGYEGFAHLTSFKPGLEQGWLETKVKGDWQGLRLTDLWGGWLNGELVGALDMNWSDGFRLSGDLQGSELDPAALVPEMPGQLELTIIGEMAIPAGGELSARWDASLGQSRLRGWPIAGRLAGRWQRGDLLVDVLKLRGDGIQVEGSGRLSQRLEARVQIADLDRLGDGWSGGMQADGWLARRAGEWVGSAQGSLAGVAFGQYSAEQGTFKVDYPGPKTDGRLDVRLLRLTLPAGRIDQATLTAAGRIDRHNLDLHFDWPSGQLAGVVSGGYAGGEWRGELLELTGHEQDSGEWAMSEPTPVTAGSGHIGVTGLELIDAANGRISLTGDFRWQPLLGTLQVDWLDLPLQYFNPWLEGPSLAGTSSGTLHLDALVGSPFGLTTEFTADPMVRWDGRSIAFGTSRANLTWDPTGLNGAAEVNLAEGGRLDLVLHSATPGQLALPEQGRFSLAWDDIALRQFSSWMPLSTQLEGTWIGTLDGGWSRGGNPELVGEMSIVAGNIKWRGADGVVNLPLQRAELTGTLQSGWLEAGLSLAMPEQGKLEGRCRLPLLLDQPTSLLSADATFDLNELGLLSLLMPGITNETHGKLTGTLHLSGSRAHPQFSGQVFLSGASADVPPLGLKLSAVEMDLSFDQTILKLERLQLVSGAGRLQGTGNLRFSGWQPESWKLNLQGENFQLLHLPEIMLEASPDLQFSGSPRELNIQGKLLVPTLLVNELPRTGVIKPSEDIVLQDVEQTPSAKIYEKLNLLVQVDLGDHVVVKAKGLDARITGGVNVETDQRGNLVGQGVLQVAQGHYATYGLKLPITRGRALFGGGLLQDPALDVLAEKTIGEVKAGVQVTGTPRRPLVKLVSTPAMPDTEILSYIVLGRPLGTAGAENDKLMLAAKALLSQGESAALQEKIKRQIGIDVLEVQPGGEDGVSESTVAVGKYLTPELYISFGRSLFSAESVAKLRYQFWENWEIESQYGSSSAADLSYRIEFR